jgi:hypothetical protein
MMMMMMMTTATRRGREVLLNKCRVCKTVLKAAEETKIGVLPKLGKTVTTARGCKCSYLVVCIQITVDQL